MNYQSIRSILCFIIFMFGVQSSYAATPSVAAGRAHAVVLKLDGTLAAWGDNVNLQGSIPAGLTGVTSIAAGSDHNLALKTDGTVFEWGADVTAPPPPGFGLSLPTPKPAGLNTVIAVAGGTSHSVALKSDGTVVAWGDNSALQTTIPAGLTTVTAIAAGFTHNLALKANGTVVGWGDNTFGKTTVPAGLTGVTAIAAGSAHSLALTTAGSIVGWGDNTSGQITFPAGLTGVTAIAAGNLFSAYIKSDGTVGVSGITTGGGNITAIPAALTNPATANVVKIAAGAGFALALQSDGTVIAWGDDFARQVTGMPAGLNIGATVVNQAPAPTAAAISTAFNTAGTTQVLANDPNVGDTYTFAVSTAATSGTATVDLYTGLATYTPNAGYVGTDSFIVTVTDNGGLSGAVTVNVTVVDTVFPVVTAPLSINVAAATVTGTAATDVAIAAFLGGATAVDNVAVVGAITNNAPATFPAGQVTTVTFTAVDGAGNTGTASATVTVAAYVDTVLPVVTAPLSINVAAATVAGTAATNVAIAAFLGGATATDNVAVVGSITNNAPATFPAGQVTTVTFSAADAAGNTGTASATVTVAAYVDTVAPVITLKGNVTEKVAQGSNYIDFGATALDNVDGDISTQIASNATVVNTSVLGIYTITYTVSDTAGNAATPAVRTVEVVVAPATIPATSGSIITTVAGNGAFGFSGDSGLATAASLRNPYDISVDGKGNLYIADSINNRIRKVDTKGIISTIAGTGGGFAGGFSGDAGLATAASLSGPLGVALDVLGNLYIADSSNSRIRKVDTKGIISTIAGTGANGFSGDAGLATAASLSDPSAVALDASGNLYIADFGNNRIRKVDTKGIISTIAGSGVRGFSGDSGFATLASLNSPTSMALDALGNLYIVDRANHCIRKVDTKGIISTIAGTGVRGFSRDGELATAALLDYPSDVALDASGNLYIAELGNYRILKVDTKGIISTIAGTGSRGFSGDGGLATAALLSVPTGVALDAYGNLYIADHLNSRIRKVENIAAPAAKAGARCLIPMMSSGLPGYNTLMLLLFMLGILFFGRWTKRTHI